MNHDRDKAKMAGHKALDNFRWCVCRDIRYAEDIARKEGQAKVYLEWSLNEAPRWVLDWYIRLGYDECAFGRDFSLLAKSLT